MDENREMLELLKKMEESGRKQLLYTRIMCGAAFVMALCFVGVCVLVKDFLPQINAVITEIPGVMAQMDTVLSNLEIVTSELASADISGMADAVDTLVSTGQSGLEQTVRKLDSIDLDTLNKAIQDLAAVIEPMAKLSKLFK